MAFVCDAWHILGSHRSRERIQKVELESSQAVAHDLGCRLKRQELGLHLRPGELVPGERPGSPCSNQPPDCTAVLRSGGGGPQKGRAEAAGRTWGDAMSDCD